MCDICDARAKFQNKGNDTESTLVTLARMRDMAPAAGQTAEIDLAILAAIVGRPIPTLAIGMAAVIDLWADVHPDLTVSETVGALGRVALRIGELAEEADEPAPAPPQPDAFVGEPAPRHYTAKRDAPGAADRRVGEPGLLADLALAPEDRATWDRLLGAEQAILNAGFNADRFEDLAVAATDLAATARRAGDPEVAELTSVAAARCWTAAHALRMGWEGREEAGRWALETVRATVDMGLCPDPDPEVRQTITITTNLDTSGLVSELDRVLTALRGESTMAESRRAG